MRDFSLFLCLLSVNIFSSLTQAFVVFPRQRETVVFLCCSFRCPCYITSCHHALLGQTDVVVCSSSSSFLSFGDPGVPGQL